MTPRVDNTRRVLILFPGALGDFLCVLPSIHALQQEHGGALVIANPGALELIEHGPFATASMDRREVADLFAASEPHEATRALFGDFAVAHSWTGYDHPGFAARLRSLSSGIVHLHKFRGMAPREHVVDYHARCVGLPPSRLQVWTTSSDDEWASQWLARHFDSRAPLLLAHPGSGAARKNWEGFDELVRRLSARSHAVAALLGPAEVERTPMLDLRVPTVRNVGLRRIAALLRRAVLYIGNDSGISHLARAVGTPSLVLFGATDALRWAPRGATVIEVPEQCAQCGPERLCTHRIPVDRVAAEIERLTSAAV
ncbi:MAG TPA: glycosyltransferase family 9 protein [Candidatus Kryptonia bacterium]|nr:glycosyltransferase family 9 protein [Candidatus Kryptonia bacterium]